MEQEFLQRKLAGEAAHIKSLEGLLVDAARERDEARDELAKTSADFHDVWESRDKVIEERERARQACNAYWHDLTRIALLCAQTDDEYPLKAVERTVRERDEALALCDARYSDACDALGIDHNDSLAHRIRMALESARYKYDQKVAEIEMLRGVGCREAKEGEPESGPCGVCLKCAEERGAKWALAQAHREVCFAVDQERAGINVRRLTGWEICSDARGKR
jgi:hypothetical protein